MPTSDPNRPLTYAVRNSPKTQKLTFIFAGCRRSNQMLKIRKQSFGDGNPLFQVTVDTAAGAAQNSTAGWSPTAPTGTLAATGTGNQASPQPSLSGSL